MTEQTNTVDDSAPAPIVEGTEEGRWKHPLETLEHPVAGWTLTSLQRLWGVGVTPFWAVTLMHETSGAEVTASNSTIDLALSDACAEANRAEVSETNDG